MSIREYTAIVCPMRLLTVDALQDTRPYPRRIVYTIFGMGVVSTFYFGPRSIPWALLASVLAVEVLFRLMILVFIAAQYYLQIT